MSKGRKSQTNCPPSGRNGDRPILNFHRIGDRPLPIRLGIFIGLLLLIWLPLAIPIYWLGDDPNWVGIVTLTLLYGEFIALLKMWGGRVYNDPQMLRSCGLELSRSTGRNLAIGLAIGGGGVLALFAIATVLGGVIWRPLPPPFPRIFIEGFWVALGVGFAEELFFRGWLLEELKRDYSQFTALWANSLLFAILHFIKPPEEILRTGLQFPGLVLLGMTLVWAKDATRSPDNPAGSLSIAIGLHAGLVWSYYVVNVGELVTYTGTLPEWITGIDRNPLAGLLGLICLAEIATLIRRLHLPVR